MSKEHMLFTIACIIVMIQQSMNVFKKLCIFLVFVQGTISYHGYDKKKITYQTFSSILQNFTPWPLKYQYKCM